MAMIFYPHEDDLVTSNPEEKLEVLMDAAERYKAVVLDAKPKLAGDLAGSDAKKRMIPRDTAVAFNWEELAKMMRYIRELSENTQTFKLTKAMLLTKLAEVYEVLRGAKMPRLEAVRIALINEAKQLGAGGN